MRRVVQSELVKAAVRRATSERPTFQKFFEDGVIWQLERGPLDSVEIAGLNPPVYLIQSIAWLHEGMPELHIQYTPMDGGIELVGLALYEREKKPAK